MRTFLLGLVLVVMGSTAYAQSGQPPGNSPDTSHFSLDVAGKNIGKAEYQLAPTRTGFHLQAHYTFTSNGTAVDCRRESVLDASYGIVTDLLFVSAGGADETASVAADASRSHFDYTLGSSAQQIMHTYEMHPGTVVLNNFDPSGAQILALLASAHPTADGKYWLLLAQGKGVYLPVTFTSAGAGDGTLNGAKLPLKHWELEISGTRAGIWTDSQNRLMQFSLAAQNVSYTRDGFTRTLSTAEQTPGADAVEERKVSFTSDGLAFPAILAMPRDRRGQLPIVVMVQGSGPQDADETIGPNKPFRDIAYGLAADGIATLRYDKRTHLAPSTMQGHMDLDYEVTNDAVAALRYAATLPEIDAAHIFLLGHSLGGTMAPVIAARRLSEKQGSVRGIIFVGAGVVSIDQTIERQMAFQAKRKGATTAQLAQQKKQWQDVFATVKDTNTPPDRVVGMAPLQLPVGYWRSWLQQDPAGELDRLGLPALVLRGFSDIQVSEQDFRLLEHANTAPSSVGEQFDMLNHLMMPVSTASTGEEYLQPGHVSSDVISTIAWWMEQAR